jgi:hypothetical protein
MKDHGRPETARANRGGAARVGRLAADGRARAGRTRASRSVRVALARRGKLENGAAASGPARRHARMCQRSVRCHRAHVRSFATRRRQACAPYSAAVVPRAAPVDPSLRTPNWARLHSARRTAAFAAKPLACGRARDPTAPPTGRVPAHHAAAPARTLRVGRLVGPFRASRGKCSGPRCLRWRAL